MKHFYDWLNIYQDHDSDNLPFLSDRADIVIDTGTGEHLSVKQPTLKHLGSFSTSINIRVSGGRVIVSGNPSRINRLDNLFGFTSLDDCVAVYNRILISLNLPPFTKCEKIYYLQGDDSSKVTKVSDGAVITEFHITSNISVGFECEDDYLRGLSTLPYRNMVPHLHTNGKTTDWKSGRDHSKASTLIYPSAYNKAFELELHTLPKIKRSLGQKSDEYKYLLQLVKYCRANGVIRMEQKLKNNFIRKHNFRFWGLFDENDLIKIHNEFLNLDNKLKVTAMTLENISQKLVSENICTGTRAANTTAMYALLWMQGSTYKDQSSKTQVQLHRSRLRKIGIDIFLNCDLSRHSPVYVKKAVEVEVSTLSIPDWYKVPKIAALRLVA